MAARRTQVPDLVGFGWAEAREIAEAAGLAPRAVGPDGQAVNGSGGVVIDQDPKPRTKVPHGTDLALRVAFGGGPAHDKEPRAPLPNPQYFEWPDTPAELEDLVRQDDRDLVGARD